MWYNIFIAGEKQSSPWTGSSGSVLVQILIGAFITAKVMVLIGDYFIHRFGFGDVNLAIGVLDHFGGPGNPLPVGRRFQEPPEKQQDHGRNQCNNS